MYRRFMNWLRQTAYGQFAHRVFLALVSAAVTVALSYLPYDTILQAVWVVLSSLFIGYVVMRQRLNETDEVRYQRLFRSRFEYLEKAEPEALTTIFAENIRTPVLKWFESDQGVPLERAQKVDALDSLAKSGDQPGQLIFRTGVLLGQWLERASQESRPPLEVIESELEDFIQNGSDLLGEKIAPGVFLRYVNPGEQRPTGIHLFHPESRCLLTVESYDSEQERRSVALSLKSSLFESMAEEEWDRFKRKVHELFPYFQPARGGSGPQRREIPFFVSAIQTDWETELKELPKKLRELMQIVEPEKTELEENPSA